MPRGVGCRLFTSSSPAPLYRGPTAKRAAFSSPTKSSVSRQKDFDAPCVPKPSCLPPFRPQLPTSTRRLLAHSRVISSWAAEGPPALVRYSFAPVCIRQVRNQPHEAWGLDTSMVFTMASRRSSVAARGTSCCISQYVGWPLQKPVNGYGRK